MNSENIHGQVDMALSSFDAELKFKSLLEEAIDERQVGEIGRYNLLLKFISQENCDETDLKAFIEAARSCVNQLKGEHETLVGAILKIKWTLKGESFVESYINFLAELVSAHTIYLRGCLKMLLQKFLPALKITDKIEDVDVRSLDKQFDNTHKAIFTLMKLVPTAPRHLLTKLSDFFPYVGKHQIFIQLYVKNMFHITKYMPSLQEKIFEIIIDNLLKIDVQILKHEIEEESDTDEELEEVQFEFEIDCEKRKVEKGGDKHDGEMKNELARKLDNLMLTLFEQIQKTCFQGNIVDWEKTEKLFADLLRVFEMVLLPTHASSCVQFILFYMCSFDHVSIHTQISFCFLTKQLFRSFLIHTL